MGNYALSKFDDPNQYYRDWTGSLQSVAARDEDLRRQDRRHERRNALMGGAVAGYVAGSMMSQATRPVAYVEQYVEDQQATEARQKAYDVLIEGIARIDEYLASQQKKQEEERRQVASCEWRKPRRPLPRRRPLPVPTQILD